MKKRKGQPSHFIIDKILLCLVIIFIFALFIQYIQLMRQADKNIMNKTFTNEECYEQYLNRKESD